MKDNLVKIAWWGKYFGEEPVLVGNKKQGTGAIFFTGCNLHCVFCQNYQISQEGLGKLYSFPEVVDILLKLQKQGVVSIDLVSPTIWWRSLKLILEEAKSQGLKIPVIWNSNAYEETDFLRQLKDVVDIYLPDFKYGDDKVAWKYSRAKNYSSGAILAIKEMLFQKGHLKLDKEGIAQTGIIVRHLILPNNIENSLLALDQLAKIDTNLTVSLMSQYCPVYQAAQYPEINRKINKEEFEAVYHYFQELGFRKGWIQTEVDDDLLPDFSKTNPFKSI